MGDYDDPELPPLPEFDDTVSSMIVVDGLPIAPKKKLDRLEKLVRKKFTKGIGEIVTLEIPLEADKSVGYAFIEYGTALEARAAVDKMNGAKLDKEHTFLVNSLEDFDRLDEMGDTYEPPSEEEVARKFPPPTNANLKNWTCDGFGRDQYAIKYGHNVAVCWNDPIETPVPLEQREGWTESYVMWSPQGRYFVTFHALGVALWGGPGFEKIARFAHPGVKVADFSPNETYLVTLSHTMPDPNDPNAVEPLVIWEVATGRKVAAYTPPTLDMRWPIFKWSPDDKYYARLGRDSIAVYSTETWDLLEGERITLPNVRDFAWSPTDPILSAWVPSADNSPARVVALEIPSRREIAQKSLFNVVDCKMTWAASGDYFCAKFDRANKSGKTFFVNLALFRMREKDVPVEDFETNDIVHAFEWEPKGHRFAMIHADSANVQRPNVSVYTLENSDVTLLKTIESKLVDTMVWSPSGKILVLAMLANQSGHMEFWNCDKMECMATPEHFMATNLAWDPTGRFLSSCVSFWRHEMENGYKIWHWTGELVHEVSMEKFFQILWRPRPPTLLTKKQEKKIRKDLHNHTKRYASIDFVRTNALDAEARQRRLEMREEFDYMKESHEDWLRDMRAARKALRNGYITDEDEDWIEEEREVEVVVDETVVLAE